MRNCIRITSRFHKKEMIVMKHRTRYGTTREKQWNKRTTV